MQKHPRQKRVLVTGGSGFLGNRLVNALLQKGFQVRLFDNREPRRPCVNVDVILGDIRRKEDVMLAVEGVDACFHTAAFTAPWGPDNLYYDTNVCGTGNVIEACVVHNVKALVFTSTASVVIDGSHIKNGDEESLRYPSKFLDAYSASKAQAEKLVIDANGRWTAGAGEEKPTRLLTCALRPHAIFGPGDSHFLKPLIDKARAGLVTHMVGDGTNLVDFTFIDNVVDAHMAALEHLVPGSVVCGQAYFITNGEPRSFWEFVNTILVNVGCVAPAKYISFSLAYAIAYLMELVRRLLGPFAWFEPTVTKQVVVAMGCHHWFSHLKATQHFGYRPRVPLSEGMAQTIAHFRQFSSDRKLLNSFSSASLHSL